MQLDSDEVLTRISNLAREARKFHQRHACSFDTPLERMRDMNRACGFLQDALEGLVHLAVAKAEDVQLRRRCLNRVTNDIRLLESYVRDRASFPADTHHLIQRTRELQSLCA